MLGGDPLGTGYATPGVLTWLGDRAPRESRRRERGKAPVVVLEKRLAREPKVCNLQTQKQQIRTIIIGRKLRVRNTL